MNIRCTPSHLHGEIDINANDSSIIFLLCAGALSEEGITLKGFKADGFAAEVLDTLDYMGANVSRDNDNITVSKGRLFGMSKRIKESELEFFVYCALGAVCEKGFIQLSGLRSIKKETVDLTVTAFSKLNIACSFDDDDELIIWGGNDITGGTADANENIYLAFALTVISCEASIPLDIHNTGGLEKTFADYMNKFNSLGGKIETIK